MRIVGVDPALVLSGYGVIEAAPGSLRHLASGVIRTRSSQPLASRLALIHEQVSGVLAAHRPGVMVLEKVFVHYHHPTTAYVLGQARGVICLAAAQAGVAVVEYAATQIKKAIVGRGQAGKHQVQRMVALQLGLSSLPKTFDVTDALALAIAHVYFLKAARISLPLR